MSTTSKVTALGAILLATGTLITGVRAQNPATPPTSPQSDNSPFALSFISPLGGRVAPGKITDGEIGCSEVIKAGPYSNARVVAQLSPIDDNPFPYVRLTERPQSPTGTFSPNVTETITIPIKDLGKNDTAVYRVALDAFNACTLELQRRAEVRVTIQSVDFGEGSPQATTTRRPGSVLDLLR